MQLYPLSLFVFQPLFDGSSGECLWLLLKTKVCFPSFVFTVFWCSTSYTVIIVFWMMLMKLVDAPARWWPCACLTYVSGLRRLERNFIFFEMNTYLWPGAQIWFRHKWRKLVTASLLLHCIDWYGCLRYWNEFCSAVFRVLDWIFLVLHFDGNVFNWIPKVIWPRMDWFWGFLLGNGFFRRLHICMDWNLQELLNFFLFWRHQIFSIFILRVILVCSLKKACSF